MLTLNPQSIDLWHGGLTLAEAGYAVYWHSLDADERERALRFKTPALQHGYIETHGRLRQVLSRYLQLPPEDIRISISEHGKPYLTDHAQISFNLSHTANRLVIAVGTDCQLGVDIELCKPRNGFTGLVDKCFAEVEADDWRRQPENLKTQAFYRYWTRKEAFVKATGLGITLGLNQCVLDPENPTRFLRVPEVCGQTEHWRVIDIELDKAVCCAVVTDQTQASIKVRAL